MSYLDNYTNLLTTLESSPPEISINEANSGSIIKNGAIDYKQTSLNTLVTNQAIKSDNYIPSLSGWKIDGNGDAEFSNVVIRGTVYATVGEIGGITIGSNSLQSSNFLSGVLGQGFRLSSDGTAEFQNIIARGKISTAVFEKNTISSVGGYVIIANSDVLGADMTASDTSTLTTSGIVFANGSIIRIKDGVDDEWMSVVSSSGSVHTVTRDLAGAYTSGANPTWKKGTAVISTGTTNSGVLELDASSTNSPKISVKTRASTTYNDLDEKVIIGNLKDKTGVDEYGLWVKSGAAYIAGFRLYEAVVSADGTGDYQTIGAAVAAGKKRIFVRSGNYTLTADINVTLDDVSITGENRGLVVISGPHTISLSGDNCSISNVTKIITDLSQQLTIGGANCVIDNCSIFCSDNASLLLDITATATNAVVKNSKIEYYVTSGKPIGIGGADCKFLDNYIYSYSDNYAVEITGPGSTFSRNTIRLDSSSASTGGGISCADATDLFVIDNYISDNQIDDDVYPVLINLVSSNPNCKITNNTLVGGCTGLYIESTSDAIATGNYFDGQGNHAVFVNGDNTDGMGHNIISSNHIKSPLGSGIYLYYARKTILSNNNIHGATGLGINGEEMTMYSLSVTGNYVKNCTGGGIALGWTTPARYIYESVISNNILEENGGYGLYANAQDCVIVGNLAKNNTSGQYSVTATGCQYSLNE